MLVAKRNAMSGKKLPYARRLAYLDNKEASGDCYIITKTVIKNGRTWYCECELRSRKAHSRLLWKEAA